MWINQIERVEVDVEVEVEVTADKEGREGGGTTRWRADISTRRLTRSLSWLGLIKPSSRCDGDVFCDDVHVWVSCKYEHVQAMVVELELIEVEVVKVVVGEAEAEEVEVG